MKCPCMYRTTFILVLTLTILLKPTMSLEPVTTGVAVVGAFGLISSAIFASYDLVQCRFYECCSPANPDFPGLERALREKLFGQHLVLDTVVKALKGHFKQENPPKSLVLSFHGWTGNGKNFVSRLIAENIYELGMKSKFVHLYIATLHFPHASHVEKYQDALRKDIQEKVKLCERSLFIFDEMDKMPSGILDALTPFLDYHDNIDGVNFRKSMFIFLSNTAGKRINDITFNYWQNGRKREEIGLKEMEEIINLASFNIKGGLWHSQLIDKNLITAFVPFLPLEYRHVKDCVRADMKVKNVTMKEAVVDKIASELSYFPPDYHVFSKTGCKRVPQKVDYIIEEMEES